MNYTFKVSKAGKEMNGSKLFNLTVTNNDERLPEYLRSTTYEELSENEVNNYKKKYNKVAN